MEQTFEKKLKRPQKKTKKKQISFGVRKWNKCMT